MLFPLLARMKPGALQYDGMRHVFLVVPVLALWAGVGVDQLHQQWVGRSRTVFPAVALACSVLAWLVWQTVQIHPYQGSYLNEGVRLVVRDQTLGDYFDFYSWGTPYKGGVEWLNSNATANFTVGAANDRYLLRSYPLRKDLTLLKSDNADFNVVMGWRKDLRKRFDAPPLFSVTCYGTDLLLIYPRRNK
jgi:hypothetical protein